MESQELNAEKAEKRTWHLFLESIAVILYLTLVIIVIAFYSEISGEGQHEAWKYVLLSIMVLGFCGYVVLSQRRIHQFTEAIAKEKHTARDLARHVSILSSLLEISSGINSKKELREILDTITREMLASFSADRCSIMLMDDEGKELVTESCFGERAEFARGVRIPVGKGISGWVLANNQPLLLNGQADASRFPGLIKKNAPISSSICVPLQLEHKSIGVLNVNIMGQEKSFTDADLNLLTIFANNASVAIHNSMLQEEKNRRIRLQTMLAQLHSPQVVQKLVEKIGDGNRPNKMREKVELAVLFSDIRGFSDLLSLVEPERIMSFLDEFYSVMNQAVFDHEGSIDKFIGDEVMAFFGAPIPLENPVVNGLDTAIIMLSYFKELRANFAEHSPHFAKLGLGIGVNFGEVIVGNVGSATRYEYTVIGQAVNLARRLCAHAESDQILTTRRTIELAGGRYNVEMTSEARFKGIPRSVNVHRVHGRLA